MGNFVCSLLLFPTMLSDTDTDMCRRWSWRWRWIWRWRWRRWWWRWYWSDIDYRSTLCFPTLWWFVQVVKYILRLDKQLGLMRFFNPVSLLIISSFENKSHVSAAREQKIRCSILVSTTFARHTFAFHLRHIKSPSIELCRMQTLVQEEHCTASQKEHIIQTR